MFKNPICDSAVNKVQADAKLKNIQLNYDNPSVLNLSAFPRQASTVHLVNEAYYTGMIAGIKMVNQMLEEERVGIAKEDNK